MRNSAFKIIFILFFSVILSNVLAQSDNTFASSQIFSSYKLSNAKLHNQTGNFRRESDTLSLFDRFNIRMEHVFKIIPVPVYSHTTEAGNIFGVAKFNLFDLSRKDKISKPSKISGVVTFSTKGRVNISFSTELIARENKFILLSFFNYNKTPEYIDGIGNSYVPENLEQVTTNRIKLGATGLFQLRKYFYAGPVLDIADYFKI